VSEAQQHQGDRIGVNALIRRVSRSLTRPAPIPGGRKPNIKGSLQRWRASENGPRKAGQARLAGFSISPPRLTAFGRAALAGRYYPQQLPPPL